MLQKSSSPYQRISAAWREVREKVRPGQKGVDQRGAPGPDYAVEAVLEDGVAAYRVFKPTVNREEMSRRMQELADLMRRKNYSGALIDMRHCKFDVRSAANDLSRESALPYAVNPLWRLALLVPSTGAGAPPAMFDALLKLHRRAGVQMQRFEEYNQALAWLQKARSGLGERL